MILPDIFSFCFIYTACHHERYGKKLVKSYLSHQPKAHSPKSSALFISREVSYPEEEFGGCVYKGRRSSQQDTISWQEVEVNEQAPFQLGLRMCHIFLRPISISINNTKKRLLMIMDIQTAQFVPP